jgi:hypothetical protein
MVWMIVVWECDWRRMREFCVKQKEKRESKRESQKREKEIYRDTTLIIYLSAWNFL